MSTVAVEYDPTTGRLGIGMVSDSDDAKTLNARTGRAWIDGAASTDSHYVANPSTTPALTARPTSPITIDGTTLKDVPAGAVINIDGDTTVVEEADDVELIFPLSGTYEVRVQHFPYLDFVTEVTV